MYGRLCPLCGARLDPGEPCDCTDEKEKKSAPPQSVRPQEINPAISLSQNKVAVKAGRS